MRVSIKWEAINYSDPQWDITFNLIVIYICISVFAYKQIVIIYLQHSIMNIWILISWIILDACKMDTRITHKLSIIVQLKSRMKLSFQKKKKKKMRKEKKMKEESELECTSLVEFKKLVDKNRESNINSDRFYFLTNKNLKVI